MDRARRNGSPMHTPFNVWIVREAQLMTELITLIRTDLQAIKSACEISRFGTHWSNELLNVAHSIYNQRIPETWCQAIGPSAPLSSWGLLNFFNDVTMRADHIEKVLTKGE